MAGKISGNKGRKSSEAVSGNPKPLYRRRNKISAAMLVICALLIYLLPLPLLIVSPLYTITVLALVYVLFDWHALRLEGKNLAFVAYLRKAIVPLKDIKAVLWKEYTLHEIFEFEGSITVETKKGKKFKYYVYSERDKQFIKSLPKKLVKKK